jgi:hypothetical protein
MNSDTASAVSRAVLAFPSRSIAFTSASRTFRPSSFAFP